MNGSSYQNYGCIPTRELARFSLLSPNQDQLKILNDTRSFLHQFGQLKEYQRREALDQRIHLLAQAALITGDHSFIQTGINLSTIYSDLKPNLTNLKQTQAILENFNKQWLEELKQIFFLIQRSPSFNLLVINPLGIEMDLRALQQHDTILLAQEAYKINESVKGLLSRWGDACSTDYGYLSYQMAVELEDFEKEKHPYLTEALLKNEVIFEKIKNYHSLTNKEGILFQISRRIIALASTALLTGNFLFLTHANDIIGEIDSKIGPLDSADLCQATELFNDANNIFKHKFRFNASWRMKLCEFKNNLQSQKLHEFLKEQKIAVEIFFKRDLRFVIPIYHEYKKSRSCLKIGFSEERVQRSRSVSTESSKSDSDYSCFSDSLSEELPDSHVVSEKNPKAEEGSYDSLLLGDDASDDEYDQRKSKKQERKESRLKRWLEMQYPIIYKHFLKQENEITFFLRNYDAKYGKNLLKDFKDSERGRKLKKFENILPLCELENCLFHSSHDQRRKHIQELAQDHQFNFQLFELFLKREPQVIVCYLKDTQSFSFFNFIKKNYANRFRQITSEKSFRILKSKTSNRESQSLLFINALSEDPLRKSKEYVYLLHANVKLRTEFHAMLSVFYQSPLESDYIEPSGEIRILKLGTDIPKMIAMLESDNNEIRSQMLDIMDDLYGKVPDIFFLKKEKKP